MNDWVVVGASGFVGSAITAYARSLGHSVRQVAAPRIEATTSSLVGLAREADGLSDIVEGLAEALHDCSVVINAAGLPDADSGASPELMGANALLPTVVGRAAKLAGVDRYLHVSSATVQGHARVLSESAEVAPFSAYSLSKALGEQLLLNDESQPPTLAVVRAVSVQARTRRTTLRLIRLAQSNFAAVARSAAGPAPLSLIENTAAAIVFVAAAPSDEVARVVLLPGDGLSMREVLLALGAQRVRTLPDFLARAAVGVAGLVGGAMPRFKADARRAEMLWFGQGSDASWLVDHGFTPPIGREGWNNLAFEEHAHPRPKVLSMVTIALSVRHFLSGQLGYLQNQGFDVKVLSSPGSGLLEIADRDKVVALPFPMAREISPLRDSRDLFRMIRILRMEQPDLLNYGTPKASLLGGVAGWVTRVPVRVYTLHGLRLETARGFRRVVLYAAEWITCHTAHVVICVSPSLRAEAIRLRLVAPRRAIVLGSGSCNGVDIARFTRSDSTPSRVASIRSSLGWPSGVPVIGFVGRLTRDKGIPELIEAFRSVREEVAGTRLLLVGDFEVGDPVPLAIRNEIVRSPDIAVTGMLPDPSDHIHMLDVLVLPTHREGLPGVILEAAVAGVPVVATNATGVRDAVIDGATGSLVPVGNSRALADSIVEMLRDDVLRLRLGAAARDRAVRDFDSVRVWERTSFLFQTMLSRRGLSSVGAWALANEEKDDQS